MNETGRPGRTLRSIGAVLAGLLVVVLVSLGVDQVLHTTGVFPPWGEPMSDGLFLLAMAYRIVIAIAGTYVTARLAPQRPMKHALAGGLVGLVLSTAGAVATWNQGPAFGPRWYPLSLVATALPCAWVGGRLRQRQLE
ncbi:MAG TPA: hypothetical protein VI589_00500 [Vicinamibacteria bacterium]